MHRRVCEECGIVFDTEDGCRRLCDYCAGERKKRQAWHGDVQRRRVRKPEAEKPKEPWVVNKQDCGGCKYFFEHGTESTCDYFLVTGQIKQPLGAPVKDCKYREKGPKAQIPGTYEQYSEVLKRKRAERAAKAEAPEKAETPQETKPKGRPKKPQKEEKPKREQKQKPPEESLKGFAIWEKPKRQKMSAEEKAQKMRDKWARRYEKMKAEHRCYKCGEPLPEGWPIKICEKCAEKQKAYQHKDEVRERMRAAGREAEKRRYEKRSAARLCIRCGIQLPEGQSGKLCAECAEKAHVYQRISRENRKCRK